MKKRLFSLLAALLILCQLTGCAVSLSDALPPLDDAAKKTQNVTTVAVRRYADEAVVTITDPVALDTLYSQLSGIRGTREKMEAREYLDTYPPLYMISFADGNGAVADLLLTDETTFYYDGYAYDALRGGADLLYFANLFSE